MNCFHFYWTQCNTKQHANSTAQWIKCSGRIHCINKKKDMFNVRANARTSRLLVSALPVKLVFFFFFYTSWIQGVSSLFPEWLSVSSAFLYLLTQAPWNLQQFYSCSFIAKSVQRDAYVIEETWEMSGELWPTEGVCHLVWGQCQTSRAAPMSHHLDTSLLMYI